MYGSLITQRKTAHLKAAISEEEKKMSLCVVGTEMNNMKHLYLSAHLALRQDTAQLFLYEMKTYTRLFLMEMKHY